MPKHLANVNWDKVKEEIRDILIQVARKQQVITYSELTSMLQTAYVHYHSHVLVSLLTDIGSAEARAGRPILPALVVTKQTGLPGAGYFKIRDERGVHIADDPQETWAEDLKQVHDYWSSH